MVSAAAGAIEAVDSQLNAPGSSSLEGASSQPSLDTAARGANTSTEMEASGGNFERASSGVPPLVPAHHATGADACELVAAVTVDGVENNGADTAPNAHAGDDRHVSFRAATGVTVEGVGDAPLIGIVQGVNAAAPTGVI